MRKMTCIGSPGVSTIGIAFIHWYAGFHSDSCKTGFSQYDAHLLVTSHDDTALLHYCPHAASRSW